MGVNDDMKGFFEAGGANLMFAMFDARDRHEREAAEIDRMRREFTVAVKFPDGIREVEAHMAQDDLFGRSDMATFRKTPNDMEGWRFVRVISGDVEWHAMQETRRYEPPSRNELEWMPDEYGYREIDR